MSTGSSEVIRRLRRPGGRAVPPVATVLAVAVVLVLVILAVAGDAIAPHDPAKLNPLLPAVGPSADHLLGTDQLGRDIYSRTISGTRAAIVGPLVIALGSLLGGSLLGLCAGYFGGRVDAIVMRWVDFMYALPSLLVTLVIVGVMGGGYWLAVALLTLFTVPYDTRLLRGATLHQRALPYVEAAESLGVRPWRVMSRHIWPNLLNVAVPNSCLNFAYGLAGLAALSFLGIGSPPGSAEWGRMVFENVETLFDNPWGALAPGLMIVVTAIAMSLLGDVAYERFSDKGSRR